MTAPRAQYSNTEQRLKRLICEWLGRQKQCVPLMYPAGGILDPTSRKRYRSPFMPPGVSDILCCYRGIYVAIEVKRSADAQASLRFAKRPAPKGRVSPQQQFFLERILRAGGIAFVAYSLEDVKTKFAQIDQVLRCGMIPSVNEKPGQAEEAKDRCQEPPSRSHHRPEQES